MVSGNKPENRNEIQLFRFSFALLFISIFFKKREYTYTTL
jgi:hypothetical protein